MRSEIDGEEFWVSISINKYSGFGYVFVYFSFYVFRECVVKEFGGIKFNVLAHKWNVSQQ